jgi:hypothetical protein
MKELKRSEKTIRKQILIDGLETEVIRDAKLSCQGNARWGKLHVYFYKEDFSGGLKVQFPTALREFGKRYIADIYKRVTKSGTEFWSAYKGTIRNEKGEVIG